MALDPTHTLLLTGSVDAEIRLFRFLHEESGQPEDDVNGGYRNDNQDVIEPLGSVQRQIAVSRVGTIHCEYSRGEMFTIVTSTDKTAELFRIRSSKDASSHKQRRKKRFVEKREQQKSLEAGNFEESVKFVDVVEAKDFLVSVRVFRMSAKIRGARLLSDGYVLSNKKTSTLDVQILLQPADNSLEVFRVVLSKQKKLSKRKRADLMSQIQENGIEEDGSRDAVGSIEKVYSLDRPGHRGDVRSISLSPDDR
eukprot:IDg10581t1